MENKYVLNYVPNYYVKICLCYSDYDELFKNETEREFKMRMLRIQKYLNHNQEKMKLCVIVFYENGEIDEKWVDVNKFDYTIEYLCRLMFCFVNENKIIQGIIGELFIKDLNDWTFKEKINYLNININ